MVPLSLSSDKTAFTPSRSQSDYSWTVTSLALTMALALTLYSSPCLRRPLQPAATCRVRTVDSCTDHFSIATAPWPTDTSVTRTRNSWPFYRFSPLKADSINQNYKYLQDRLLRRWAIIGDFRRSPAAQASCQGQGTWPVCGHWQWGWRWHPFTPSSHDIRAGCSADSAQALLDLALSTSGPAMPMPCYGSMAMPMVDWPPVSLSGGRRSPDHRPLTVPVTVATGAYDQIKQATTATQKMEDFFLGAPDSADA